MVIISHGSQGPQPTLSFFMYRGLMFWDESINGWLSSFHDPDKTTSSHLSYKKADPQRKKVCPWNGSAQYRDPHTEIMVLIQRSWRDSWAMCTSVSLLNLFSALFIKGYVWTHVMWQCRICPDLSYRSNRLRGTLLTLEKKVKKSNRTTFN